MGHKIVRLSIRQVAAAIFGEKDPDNNLTRWFPIYDGLPDDAAVECVGMVQNEDGCTFNVAFVFSHPSFPDASPRTRMENLPEIPCVDIGYGGDFSRDTSGYYEAETPNT